MRIMFRATIKASTQRKDELHRSFFPLKKAVPVRCDRNLHAFRSLNFLVVVDVNADRSIGAIA